MTRVPVYTTWQDTTMVGTLHAPALGHRPGSIGVLLLNAGPAPRAGNSDLSVHIAERLAAGGTPCFRMDLPGLGDSHGPSWPTIDEYWARVQQGHNDAAVVAMVSQLRDTFDLSALVIGGLCAGAISAVRAVAESAHGVAGLLLLEPNFRMSSETGPNARAADACAPPAIAHPRTRWARALELNAWLYLLTGDRKLALPFTPLRPLFRRVLARRIGHTLPPDTNTTLVVSWERALERRIPTLVVSADGQIADRYVSRILDALPRASRRLVERVRIEGSNHIFTAGAGRLLATNATEQWLTHRFGFSPQAAQPEAGTPLGETASAYRSAPA